MPASPAAPSVPPFTVAAGIAYFAADDGTDGRELWKSDGTHDGTTLIQDSRPGSELSSWLMNAGGTLVYAANDGVNGQELWASDGTSSRTGLVADIRPGDHLAQVGGLAHLQGNVMFAANDGVSGRGLWSSDGTPAGTSLVKAIEAFAEDRPASLSWSVTGSSSRVSSATDHCGRATAPWERHHACEDVRNPPFDLTAVDDVLFFRVAAGCGRATAPSRGPSSWAPSTRRQASRPSRARCSSWATSGRWGLWRSDGTTPVLVKNLHNDPGGEGLLGGLLSHARRAAHFISIADQLWKSDGTTDGTSVVKDVDALSLADVGGTLYFNGRAPGSSDRGLWKSDGTPDGTVGVSGEPYPSS